MTAALVDLAEYRRSRERPPMPDFFDIIDGFELLALANIAVLYGLIALCRIVQQETRRP